VSVRDLSGEDEVNNPIADSLDSQNIRRASGCGPGVAFPQVHGTVLMINMAVGDIPPFTAHKTWSPRLVEDHPGDQA
jgi:hypothetical protein